MNSEFRSLITDIKAAVRIGHTESIWAALEGLLDLPQVAGNPPMNKAFLEQAVLPIGQTLATGRLNLTVLQTLVSHHLAALRAISGTALAWYYCTGQESVKRSLEQASKDPREDVRQAISLALTQASQNNPAKLVSLAEEWLAAGSPRLQATAIAMLPGVSGSGQAMALLSRYQPPSDPAVRASLVDTLSALALSGHEPQVMALLVEWAKTQENNLWLICKTLSGSWAAGYVETALEVLGELLVKHGQHKQIENALQALLRHGAGEGILKALEQWQQSEHEALQKTASRFLEDNR